MEYSYDYDIRQTAEHNRRAKINNFMSKAPKLPKDADQWFFEKTAGEDYMFKEKGTENFSCTNCGESFDRSELTPIHWGKKKATHNDMVRCPSCGKLVQVKTRTDSITAKPESLYKLDKIDETASVLRIFRVDIEWDSGRRRIEIDEEIRIVIYKQDLFKNNRYNYKIFYNIPWEGWHKSNNLNYRARDGYMYPGDYSEALKNTVYKDAIRIIEFLAAAGWKLNYNRLLSGVYQVKGYAEKIEYLAKGRFRNLLRETVTCTEYPRWNMAYYGPLDIRAKNINKMFYINDRQKINRIRDENGGNEMVRWMQYSDETGEKIPTETLRWLLRCGLRPENIRYHAGKYLSTTQLMNYIRRQQKEQYPGFTEEAVLEQYNDYLSMCKACNKNMQDELTYRPRELKRRHDEIVINKQQMDILKEMMASQKEREQYAQEMREKYPTAEKTLHEMIDEENEKTSYDGKEYTTYEALQRQRKLELTMRVYRQDIKLMKEGGVSELEIMGAKARYKKTMDEYVKFSKVMKLPEQRDRIYMDGLGRISTKVGKKILSSMKISIPKEVAEKAGLDKSVEKKINQAIKKLDKEYTIYLDSIEGGKLGRGDLFVSGAYLDKDGIIPTFVLELDDAAARTSAKCPESDACNPIAVRASVTISEVVARSSPDAAARFMMPSMPFSISSVFQPAIAISACYRKAFYPYFYTITVQAQRTFLPPPSAGRPTR